MMRRAIFTAAAAILLSVAGLQAVSAQQSYTYTVTRTRTVEIDWRPEEKSLQRYTVAVSPLRLFSNGLKFDFEKELSRPGLWFGTSLTAYLASPRQGGGWYGYDYDGNNRASFVSGWDDYHRMWGLGTSAFFKNTFHRRGWYFTVGVVFDFFRVGVTGDNYIPWGEDGLTFYDRGRALDTKSYFKPTAQFNFGKHIAISKSCFFNIYAGLGYSHAFYKRDADYPDNYGDRRYYHQRFDYVGGFAYRGLTPVGGFRFGVLLWDSEK